MNAWLQIEQESAADYVAFRNALVQSRVTQAGQLRAILDANRETEYGRRYRFDAIRDADEFRAQVPIHSYSDIAHDVARMAQGENNVLCTSPVHAYEETSGSSGAVKLVPYTQESLTDFQRALLPWFADLLRARPGIRSGRAYWALSPVARAPRWAFDGRPIGLDEAAYLGSGIGSFFRTLSIVPPALAGVTNLKVWRYLTLRFLLEAEDLTFISVWSPTFLFPLLDALMEQRERLIEDIASGEISGLPKEYAALAPSDLLPNPKRARTIANALRERLPDTRRLWPRLDTISCWTDASSRRFLLPLRKYFPYVFIQGKGLLATEGIVTLPLAGCDYPVLALRSGFYEFLDSQGVSHLCDGLDDNESYRVVMTTRGGLYRYDLGDRVRVRGWFEATPMLEFIGRAGLVSDLCGEKLTDDFVSARLAPIPGFSMLAPTLTPSPHYVLYLDCNECAEAAAQDLAASIEAGLAENPQYRYARQLGQLGPVLPHCIPRAMERYVHNALARGQRLGDVKPPTLRTETDWDQRLTAI